MKESSNQQRCGLKKITTKVECGVRESVNMAHLRADKTEKGHGDEIL